MENKNGFETKKFLFVTVDAVTIDLAWQVKKEGHLVKFFIEDKNENEIGNGFVEKVNSWKEHIDWADVIIFDGVDDQGEIANELREKGKAVIGGTPYTDKLESERAFGQEELSKHNILVPMHKDFTFLEAIEFVKENPGKYFIKPSANTKILKEILFIGDEDDGRDVIQVLKDYDVAWKDKIKQIQLQKKITGVEIAVGAFFNGKEFIYPINVNFEHNNWFPGNLGPAAAEMGTSMYWSNPNKLFNTTIKKFEKKFAEEKYVGYVDLKCVVNNNGIYALDWTTRFGYPTISIQQEGMTTPIGEFLYKLANGIDPKLKIKTGFQVGVRLVMPPFPFNDPETFEVKSKDSVIYFKKKKIPDGVHIEDIKIVNGEWVITGTTGTALIVCGCGSTMKQAKQQAYSRVKQINIPHMYYRDDIADRWIEDSDKLHNWGYLREL
jgi:phosphoribosylamine---glycine ligase